MTEIKKNTKIKAVRQNKARMNEKKIFIQNQLIKYGISRLSKTQHSVGLFSIVHIFAAKISMQGRYLTQIAKGYKIHSEKKAGTTSHGILHMKLVLFGPKIAITPRTAFQRLVGAGQIQLEVPILVKTKYCYKNQYAFIRLIM